MKIGKEVLLAFTYLKQNNLLKNEDIENLLSVKFTREHLKGRMNNFPFLLQVDSKIDEALQRRYGTKQSRFYTQDKFKLVQGEKVYALTSQLHAEDRDKISGWLLGRYGFSLDGILSGNILSKIILEKSKEILNEPSFQNIVMGDEFFYSLAVVALSDLESYFSRHKNINLVELKKRFEESKDTFSDFSIKLTGDERGLWIKIATLIAYIDEKAANKRQLNTYDDFRTIGHTGINQNDWCTGILKHLIDPELEITSEKVVGRTLYYIKNPTEGINIFSNRHIKRFGEIFVSTKEGEPNFLDVLAELKKTFSDLFGQVKNESNKTLLIGMLLYDSRIRELWDLWEYDSEFLEEYLNEHRAWFYAPGDAASMWIELYKSGECAIGWELLGNHKNYSSKVDIKKSLDEKYNREESEDKNANTIWNFSNELKVGDIIFAKEGISKLIGIGIVIGEQFFNESLSKYKNRRLVKWILKKSIKAPDNPGLPQTALSLIQDEKRVIEIFKKFDYELSVDDIDELEFDKELTNNNSFKSGDSFMPAQNIILYGPPGTGKTYESRKLALKLIGESGNDFIARFNELQAAKQVVFITFHQSYNYEQFVEGIIPETNEEAEDSSTISYRVVSGIFKSICQEALCELIQPKQNVTDSKTLVSFEEAYNLLEEEIEENETTLTTTQGSDFTVKSSKRGGMRIDVKDGGGWSIAKATLKQIYIDLTSIKKPPYTRQDIRLVSDHSLASYIMPIINAIAAKSVTDGNIINTQVKKFKPDEVLSYLEKGQYDLVDSPKQFVIVIDEINRGNISQILGELIPLIEPNKRIGEKEAIKITLPYSKDSFGVPRNLHIIGTMNTADRSVEALDTALRRRFDFKELVPSEESGENLDWHKFEKFDVKHLFSAINERIEYFLDRDHLLGHAFYVNLGNEPLEELKARFANKIIPLLKEYFYEDWEKIGMILGEGFVEAFDGTPKFAKFESNGDYGAKLKYVLIKRDQWTEDTFLKVL